jgi:glycerophosphoryl diester phosphodiesterase
MVQIVCHKGANKLAPENTWASSRLCVDWGVDYLEMDVHTSADGVLYVFHGPYLQKTTNGNGWIGAFTAAELDQLDAGSSFSPEFGGERLPRLEPLLRWLKGKVKVFFDVKNVTVERMAALVRELGMQNECFFWNSDEEWLRQLKAHAPELAIKVNIHDLEGLARAKEMGARLVEIDHDRLTPELARACHAEGLEVMALYLGSDEQVIRKVEFLGADLLNTDYGNVALKVFSKEKYD